MAGVELGREQLQWLMMRLHDVPAEKRIAMMGRLKHLQRLGWPRRANPGKGSRVKYDAEQVLSVALALELIQMGSTPERVVDDLHLNTAVCWRANYAAAKAHKAGGAPILLVMNPWSLTFALDPDRSGRSYMPMLYFELSEMDRFLSAWAEASSRRMGIVNLSALISKIDEALVGLGLAKANQFIADVSTAAISMGKTIELIDEVRGDS